jgi:hypothetical protein
MQNQKGMLKKASNNTWRGVENEEKYLTLRDYRRGTGTDREVLSEARDRNIGVPAKGITGHAEQNLLDCPGRRC